MNIDDDIWPNVEANPWKYRTGRVGIRGIIWHATRSGQAQFSPETEYGATLNWFKSPNNRIEHPQGAYSGMSNYVIGGGRICQAVPDDLVPAFSAGVHDYHALSVEMAQPLSDIPYDPRDIALARQFAQEKSTEYGFSLGRLTYVDGLNSQWPGEVGHEDTKQGRRSGKSDPGQLFWGAYLSGGDDMSAEGEKEIIRILNGIWNVQAGDVDPNTPDWENAFEQRRALLAKLEVVINRLETIEAKLHAHSH